jgi:hypothetical protein
LAAVASPRAPRGTNSRCAARGDGGRGSEGRHAQRRTAIEQGGKVPVRVRVEGRGRGADLRHADVELARTRDALVLFRKRLVPLHAEAKRGEGREVV